MTHANFVTGQPCDCTFDWTKFGQSDKLSKVAGKLEDFLKNPKSRPDLQTPEGQAWLKLLEHHQNEVGDKLDPITPWLTREWKKGRIKHDVDLDRALGGPEHVGHMYYNEPLGEPIPGQFGDQVPQRRRALPSGTLSHWADFHGANHPVRRSVGDIMQHQVMGYRDLADQWTEALQAEAKDKALAGGDVVHTTPDNWTIRKLTTPEELTAEGETMGHCVGGYHREVADGDSLIYSLRDPEGKPHATTEIKPTQFAEPKPFEINAALDNHTVFSNPKLEHTVRQPLRDFDAWQRSGYQGPEPPSVTQLNASDGNASELHDIVRNSWERNQAREPLPHKGKLVQIQGKSDQVPLPEYQAQMKHWFQSFPEEDRPSWNDSRGPITHIGSLVPGALTWTWGDAHRGDPDEDVEDQGGYGPHGDYGLVTPHRDIDYKSTVQSLMRPRNHHEYRNGGQTHNPGEVQTLYKEAARRGEIPQFAKAVAHYGDIAQNDRDQLEDYSEGPHYPGEDYEDEPERWEEEYEQNPHEYSDGKDAFAQARDNYDSHMEYLDNEHAPTQLTHELYRHLNQHALGREPDGSLTYQNALKSGGELLPNDRQLQVQHLPQGAQYTDLGGGVHTNGEEDRYYNPNLIPPHIALPPDSVPTTAKTAAHDPILDTPKKDYEGDWGDESEPWEAKYQRGKEWDRAVRRAISLGHMTPEDAMTRGYYPSGHEGGGGGWSDPKHGWKPLPSALYHVTTNVPGVLASGLKTRSELGQFSGKGLGAGDDDTISFTDNPQVARDVYNTIREGIKVARGEITPNDLMDQAKRGAMADRPWWPDMLKHKFAWDGQEEMPTGLHDFLKGQRRDHSAAAKTAEQWAESGHTPDERSMSWMGGDNQMRYVRPARPLTPEEKQESHFDFYKDWLAWRQFAGGPENPLFMSNDVPGLANTDPEHTGILTAAPKQGALGYGMSGMNEWRVPTGDAVDVTHVNGQPIQPIQPQQQPIVSKVVRLAHPLYRRWAYSPASGQVTLSDNDGDPLEVKYHGDLADELNEPNLVHGYAYRLGDGWRLTDYDHKPLTDHHIIAQVMRKLAGTPDQPGRKAHADMDWARCHLSMPT